MHCDRVSDEARDLGRGRERVSEHDDREARYWTRKLYEFEDKDPDRYAVWSHHFQIHLNYFYTYGNYWGCPNFKVTDKADKTTFSFYVLPTQVGTQRLQGAVSRGV